MGFNSGFKGLTACFEPRSENTLSWLVFFLWVLLYFSKKCRFGTIFVSVYNIWQGWPHSGWTTSLLRILLVSSKQIIFLYLTFTGQCIVIYSYNTSQQDALFLYFILERKCTYFGQTYCPSLGVLTLILLIWRIWWARNNVSKCQMRFNSAFKGLILYTQQ